MRKAETKDRIKKAMEIREIKQAELVEKTGIDKGQMSSYLSGKYKPKQKNLNLIAQALSVDEAWLMGFDVPMKREESIQQWDREAKQFENHINAFYYQMQSLGWTYEWLDKENLYRFSNGTAFFKINNEKFSDFVESSQQFYKEQLEKLYDEYHEQTKILLFSKNDSHYVNAAHADNYANAPEELKQLEEDIMDDENF